MRRMIRTTVFTGLAALFTTLGAVSNVFAASRAEVIHKLHMDELNQAAPDFVFMDAQGHASSLTKLKGKAVLLHFWASWCTPCKKELPELVQVTEKLDIKRWAFLPIAMDEPDQRAKAIAFLRGLKPEVPFYQLRDPKSADQYKTWGLPVTYLVSPSGEIVARALGRRDWIGAPGVDHDLNELFANAHQ